MTSLVEVAFALARSKIVDAYHVKFLDYREVMHYYARLTEYLKDLNK